LRSSETSRLEPISTNVVAAPMTSAFSSEFVTAIAGQRPSAAMNTGFSRQSPLASSGQAGLASRGSVASTLLLFRFQTVQ